MRGAYPFFPALFRQRRPAAAALILLSGLAAGCQGGSGKAVTPGGNQSLAVMQRISSAAQECWFRSKADDFRPYRLADELNSLSGRPRLLLVPADKPEALPLLVIQAEGAAARVQVFGPLMEKPVGSRIADDVRRWAGGATGCTGQA